ncbi:MAG: hypothetical protein COX57_13715 [Alphaproteobacteria bacterium CG_4_10_14_0_2_um_filter_63_37]|nr:MAG: hypothetical protein AUJ55_08585 [Proteobacteria bacterium CG1_02_64_396]PJA23428.1 MAG: hypothetical protein COX57_13715 [Alphaproteobacteria bacterium CG_4_10_14_0_2_um_filter_63_37]
MIFLSLRRWIPTATVLVVSLLQTLPMAWGDWHLVKPDMVLIFLAVAWLYFPILLPVWVVWISGFYLDLFTPMPLGSHPLLFFVAFLLLGLMRSMLVNSPLGVQAIALFGVIMVMLGLDGVINLIWVEQWPGLAWWGGRLWGAVLACVLLFPIVRELGLRWYNLNRRWLS